MRVSVAADRSPLFKVLVRRGGFAPRWARTRSAQRGAARFAPLLSPPLSPSLSPSLSLTVGPRRARPTSMRGPPRVKGAPGDLRGNRSSCRHASIRSLVGSHWSRCRLESVQSGPAISAATFARSDVERVGRVGRRSAPDWAVQGSIVFNRLGCLCVSGAWSGFVQLALASAWLRSGS